MGGGSANNRILALVKGTNALIIGNFLSIQEIQKKTSTPIPPEITLIWMVKVPTIESI